MSAIEEIKFPIHAELELFEKTFKEAMSSDVPLLDRIMHYITRRKGKQMRPILVLLTAKLLNDGSVPHTTYRGAALIELFHTASLIHDDVVDDSDMRRGFFSVNALWKNKIAVLVGDYLITKGFLKATENNDLAMLSVAANTGMQMVEGELLQIEKARRLNIDEQTYYRVISQKTAVLMSACCTVAAISVGADEETIQRMRVFGETIGMAFQIKDDLFDYTQDKIGKPTGIDIREQKMTLPLIYAINTADKPTRKWLINSVKKHNLDKKRVKEVIEYVRSHGGLEYAVSKMEEHKRAALDTLAAYPDSPARKSLEALISYVTEREL